MTFEEKARLCSGLLMIAFFVWLIVTIKRNNKPDKP